MTERPLLTRPGSTFAYGGPGFQVAGAVVEAVTGQTWAEVFRQAIAEPLGMTRTYWHHLRLNRIEPLPLSETRNPILQGGAISTAADLMRFMGMLSEGGVWGGRGSLDRFGRRDAAESDCQCGHDPVGRQCPRRGAL